MQLKVLHNKNKKSITISTKTSQNTVINVISDYI